MTKKMRIVMAQLNLRVGDIEGNLQKHLAAAATARDKLSADMIVFPELSLVGYPAEDLLLRREFIADAKNALAKFKSEMKNIYCLVGHPHEDSQHLYNSTSLLYNGKEICRYAKQRLPNYGVFDECRYFTPGNEPCIVNIQNIPVGIIICEDVWKLGPTREAAAKGARIVVVPNASPFEIDKHEQRLSVLSKRAIHDNLPIIYVNQVGGQDDLIFDGGSMVVNAQGNLSQFAGFFNETLFPVDIDAANEIRIDSAANNFPSTEAKVYNALVLALRDYIEKNNFPGVLVGVSGGIDSALTLAIAVDALGKDRVRAVFMPSRYSADISMEDAYALTKALGVSAETISIEPTYKTFLESLAPCFVGKKPDIAEENIQARCRAVILMALSNKFGYLVLTTGNRSEIAVGYCTLYGDMAGGFGVLKDVPKTLVYKLANYRNQIDPVIPQRTIERAPTAELAPDQKDQDSLPPYDMLDAILDCYLNHGQSIEEIAARGYDKSVIEKVVSMIRKSEYKRKQSALGPHINHKSFGKDWRYPVTNGYKK